MATYDDYMAQISQARQDLGQRIAGLPQFQTNLSEEVYGREQALPSLRSQVSDQIKALYDVDVRAADRYANPQSEMFIRNPYNREKIMSQQHQGGLGQIQDLQNLIAQRQDVLGNAMEKGLEIYKAGLEAQKFNYQSLLDELDAQMKIDAAKRSAAGSARKTSPTFSQIVGEAYKNAPTTTGNPGDTISQGGFNYAWDTVNNRWYPSDFGAAAQLEGMLNLAQQNPYFDEQYGAEVYPYFGYQKPDSGTQWEYNVQQDQILTQAVNQVMADTVGMSAADTYNAFLRTYGNEATLDQRETAKNFIYREKGEINPESLLKL